MSSTQQRLIILGAAGRDFHDFNVFWRDNPAYEVVAFTAAQIPDIAGRTYPPELAGPRYPRGVPIYDESALPGLIREHRIDVCAIAYSDLAHEEVMHKASLVNACGANFMILGYRATQLSARKPVIAVCAVRTGCGKSQTSRAVVRILKSLGKKVAAVRHPMPYGDLTKQVCMRFATFDDLDRYDCTIEEREEFEPHVAAGNVVYAGIDYARILREAESEAEVILWDGGNNDMPFFQPDLTICVTDPLRPGHEVRYYPGETNLRMADVVVVNKMDTARLVDADTVLSNIAAVNPRATVVRCNSPLTVNDAAIVRGKRALVVEDGPTVTHGEMAFGAGYVAAKQYGAAAIVDPRPTAVGSIRATFAKYPHCTEVLPAVGYGAKQIAELEQTINAAACDVVLVGTPIDLTRVLKINKPALRVTYELEEQRPGQLEAAVRAALSK
jgi:predicted GTPase